MSVTDTFGVKYIGSKASLVGAILGVIDVNLGTPDTLKVIDVFTGTTRVGQAFRMRGWEVQSSDLSWASEAYAHAFLIRTQESGKRIPALLHQLLDSMPATLEPGWITNHYCDVSGVKGGTVRMWKQKNGLKGDYLRNTIAAWEAAGTINHHEAMILTADLIFGLDRVDNTVGVQQAYLKNWAKRADDDLAVVDMPYPPGSPAGTHQVGDCMELTYQPADVAYIDPPYSGHSYSTYYHLWDSITRWDKPAVGLKTNRRLDRVSGSETYDPGMKSLWNYKSTALKALLELCERLPVKHILISYNDESLIPHEDLTKALKDKFGQVRVTRVPYQRNIMAQIGNAELSDTAIKTKNTELLLWINKN